MISPVLSLCAPFARAVVLVPTLLARGIVMPRRRHRDRGGGPIWRTTSSTRVCRTFGQTVFARGAVGPVARSLIVIVTGPSIRLPPSAQSRQVAYPRGGCNVAHAIFHGLHGTTSSAP